jgi:G3E family GTPase
VVTVDAVNAMSTLERYIEAVRQVAAADLVLLTKTDLAPTELAAEVEGCLKSINPQVRIMLPVHGVVPAARLFGVGQSRQGVHDIEAWVGCEADHAPDHGDHHVHPEHTHGIHTLAVMIDAPVRWSDLLDWMETLREMKGPGLLRLKGLVNIAEKSGRPLVMHAVQAVFHPPIFLDEWPSGDHRTRLVFILHGIGRQTVEETLDILRGERVQASRNTQVGSSQRSIPTENPEVPSGRCTSD